MARCDFSKILVQCHYGLREFVVVTYQSRGGVALLFGFRKLRSRVMIEIGVTAVKKIGKVMTDSKTMTPDVVNSYIAGPGITSCSVVRHYRTLAAYKRSVLRCWFEVEFIV